MLTPSARFTASPARSPGRKFMAGEPMKPATYMVAGSS
jgi:hypothetical protein